MPEYIEREAIKKVIGDLHLQNYGVALIAIMNMPAADVVEVVRCKDCEHWGGIIYGFVCRKFSGIETKICMHSDDFCSYGKRKEVDNGHP